jgi:DNA-binding transcriptional LysR family regulator
LRIGTLADSSLIARSLAPSRLACCCSPAYAERHSLPDRPEQLAEHECLLYVGSTTRTDVWNFKDGNTPLPVRVAGRFTANNGDVLMAAAIDGLGIACLPTFITGPALEDGSLVRILTDWPLQGGTIHAVYPSNRHVTGRVRAFTEFLAQRIGREPYWDRALGVG